MGSITSDYQSHYNTKIKKCLVLMFSSIVLEKRVTTLAR